MLCRPSKGKCKTERWISNVQGICIGFVSGFSSISWERVYEIKHSHLEEDASNNSHVSWAQTVYCDEAVNEVCFFVLQRSKLTAIVWWNYGCPKTTSEADYQFASAKTSWHFIKQEARERSVYSKLVRWSEKLMKGSKPRHIFSWLKCRHN